MKTKQAAKKIEKMGQKGDTVLAHINPKEAGLLKAMGGAGKRNPKTGLLSYFYEGADPMGPNAYDGGGLDFGGPSFEGADPMGPNAYGGPDFGMNFAPGESPAPGGAGTLGDIGYSFADQGKFNWGDAMKSAMRGSTLGPLGMIGGGLLGGFGGLGGLFGRGNGPEDPGSGLGMAGGITSAGNGFNGPPDGPEAPTGALPGTTPGTTGLPITPPNWGSYGPSPFTFKFGKPRDNAGLLNYGG